MATIASMLRKVENALDGIYPETERIINQHEQEIINLNVKDQIFTKHQDREGKPLPKYKKDYKMPPGADPSGFPKKKGEPYNLVWTGDFKDMFHVEVMEYDQVTLFNTDPKQKKIFKKTGDKVVGLNKENQNKLRYEMLKPELVKYLKKVIHG